MFGGSSWTRGAETRHASVSTVRFRQEAQWSREPSRSQSGSAFTVVTHFIFIKSPNLRLRPSGGGCLLILLFIYLVIMLMRMMLGQSPCCSRFRIVGLGWPVALTLHKLIKCVLSAFSSCPPPLQKETSVIRIVGCFSTFSLPLTHCLSLG